MIEDKMKVLYRIVQALVEQYQGYINLIDEQKRAIVNNDIEGLNQCNIQLDSFGQEMLEMENRRLLVLREISNILNVKITNVRELESHYDGPLMSEVSEKVAELKALLNEVKIANSVNHKLVQSSREFIRSSIGIITGYTQQNKANKFQTYGQNGSMGNQKKQARNLINRSI